MKPTPKKQYTVFGRETIRIPVQRTIALVSARRKLRAFGPAWMSHFKVKVLNAEYALVTFNLLPPHADRDELERDARIALRGADVLLAATDVGVAQ